MAYCEGRPRGVRRRRARHHPRQGRPVDADEPVLLEKLESDGTWSQVDDSTFASSATGTDASTGAPYSFTVTPAASGSPSYRVVVDAYGDRAATTTEISPLNVYRAGLGTMRKTGNEYVTLKNTGRTEIRLKSWTITTKAGKKLKLLDKPLAAGRSVRVHPGSGRTTRYDMYLRRGSCFGDRQDRLRLRDAHGRLLGTKSY